MGYCYVVCNVTLSVLKCKVYSNVGWTAMWVYNNVEVYECNIGCIVMLGVFQWGMYCNSRFYYNVSTFATDGALQNLVNSNVACKVILSVLLCGLYCKLKQDFQHVPE